MFEKYTEKARRVIFYARYEVSQLGAGAIGPEHLLLGLLREDKALISRFLPSHVSTDGMRQQVEARAEKGSRISTSLEVPLSDVAKRALAYAAEESESLSHKHIGPEHLLLGLLREEGSLAAQVLRESGIESPSVRRYLEGEAGGEGVRRSAHSDAMSDNLNVSIIGPPDRELLAAEITSGGERLAELNLEGGVLSLEIYPRRDRRPWRISYDGFLEALRKAKESLTGGR